MTRLERARARAPRVLALLALHGCGRAASAPAEGPPAERTAWIARACSELEGQPEGQLVAGARAFVEIAEVAQAPLPDPLGPWLRAHPARVRAAAHLVAFPGVPTTVPWGACVDAVCSSKEQSLTLTATLPERARAPLRLALRFEVTPSEAHAPRALLDTQIEVEHAAPVALPRDPELSSGSIVVTAYVLQKHDDLRRIIECQAESVATPPPTTPRE